MFDKIKDLSAMLGHARELKAKMEQLQEELARKTVEADAGAGAVRVVMNGRFEVLSVHLDRPMIATLAGEGADADVQMIQELIASAFNAALIKAQETAREEMTRLTGVNLPPGLDKLMGS